MPSKNFTVGAMCVLGGAAMFLTPYFITKNMVRNSFE
jgi:hypothetical protein